MAAALQELGRGKVTSVDLLGVKDQFVPSIEEQLHITGLEEFVEIHRMKTGYTWFLHDEILRNTSDGNCQEIYDLCIIDGPKNWTIDGAAFFMVDKLLKNNSWIVFDDYCWTYGSVNASSDITDGVTHRNLSDDELNTPQIRDVFELLVTQHPNYSEFLVFEGNDWALAKKSVGEVKTYNTITRNKHNDRLLKSLYKKFSKHM
jgi:hypothetical protein